MEFPRQSGRACACCGDALTGRAGVPDLGFCRACRMMPPPFARAVAYGVYEGRMKEAIHALKYGRIQGMARGLGRLLAEAIRQLAGEAPGEILVVPVPLHRSKYAQRGFNQARSLAAEAIGNLRRSHPEWRLTLAPSALMRLRATESQAGLSPHERRLNIRGAFSVSDPRLVAGRNILLVDDILTTGATAREAARTLIEAGAEAVWVATLARAREASSASLGAAEEDGLAATGQAAPPKLPPESATRAGSLPSPKRSSS